MIKNVLSIAGVDPSGGAGVLADVKTFCALGCYGMGVVAALTAQNTQAVTGVMPVPAGFVTRQIDAIFDDIEVAAVKIGMLGSIDVMEAVAGAIERRRPRWTVLDTVMVAKSGDRLMPDDAVDFFRSRLLPLADVITPNLPEAGVLLGGSVDDAGRMPEAARQLRAMCGPQTHVYLKGGHLAGDSTEDLLLTAGGDLIRLPGRRIATRNTHGTGCTLSSAIAALLAQTDDVALSCTRAKQFVARAIADSGRLSVGGGHGPVHHFTRLYEGGPCF